MTLLIFDVKWMNSINFSCFSSGAIPTNLCQQGTGEAAGAKAETSSDTNKENDNVVDADYKVVDDDQK